MYVGREGQWMWIVHRITGIGVLLFLMIHILDTSLILAGPEAYNHALSIYRNPVFRLSEVALFGAVLFHAINGVRIILIDFWPNAPRYHRQMSWVTLAIFTICYAGAAVIMIRDIFWA